MFPKEIFILGLVILFGTSSIYAESSTSDGFKLLVTPKSGHAPLQAWIGASALTQSSPEKYIFDFGDNKVVHISSRVETGCTKSIPAHCRSTYVVEAVHRYNLPGKYRAVLSSSEGKSSEVQVNVIK